MNTAAISKNRTVTKNHTDINKKTTGAERLKRYILDNAAYFAVSAAMTAGNPSAAVQIMKHAQR